MEPPKRQRLFVAVGVPAAHLAAIEDATADLQETLPTARWTSTANRHVTLKFLGPTDPELIPEVEAAIRANAGAEPSSELTLGELGVFPSRARARVLWVGLLDPAGTLTRLAARLDEALVPLGFPVEDRAFTAHLTLARFKTPIRIEATPQVDLAATGPFDLDRIGLWRSHLTPKGAGYERLGEFPLGLP
ncbi:MAG: 2,3-cyclic 3-phosphodiesterase [Actinomycetota bacterium]|jgi:2'-5' RNA ligase|nr:2,3-cyclic 3-phosphodiesterase [Actinomycetota bacterium]